MTEVRKLIIIGSGPAGLTAAIYASRANLKPLLFAGQIWGGQLMNTSEVENFPGFPQGIMGPELINGMVAQAKKFGTEMIYKDVIRVEFQEGGPQKVFIKQSGEEVEYQAQSVIVASGAKPRKLGIPGESEYWGKGVSSCATCDGAFYKEKVVAVVGGGDSAMEEALFLTHFAQKVYVIHRRDELRASKIMQDRARENSKIEFVLNTEVREVLGDQDKQAVATADNPLRAQGKVNGLQIEDVTTGEKRELAVDGFFLGIGYIPETEIFSQYIDVDAKGYALPAPSDIHSESMDVYPTMTKVSGVFVAGDVEDHRYRQAITAAADGCKSSLDAERWLSVQGA